MLKYQRPCAWFTSNPDGELIKRSDTKELDPHVIRRQFCEGTRKHDCVAYYVSYTKTARGAKVAKVEYFDDTGLENFLLNRPKENNGIVQKFEKPNSPYNSMIRAYWTPHKLQMQQRVNKAEISDLRVVMNDRLSTFDGQEHLSTEFDIKSYKLKARLEEYVKSIVEHVKKLLPSSYTLWTMECFFKLTGKNKLLFLWCNDLKVFNTNEPPKLEAFLTPPIAAHVASKHKYEKSNLKKEYFKCPCAGYNIDHHCDQVNGLHDISQMKITSYRYMILYHQNQHPIDKDVKIPEDDEYSKLSPYRQKWIEEDEMIKFKENSDVKAYELKNGSLVYQMPRNKEFVTELSGWKQIPPLPVSNADSLVFKFLSKLAIVDGKVIQAHHLNDYSKQDLADFRRFFHNVVVKDPEFLERKMKVCDACCMKFNASADDNMCLEMSKLVVGPTESMTASKSRIRFGSLSRMIQSSSTLSFSKSQLKIERSQPILPKIKHKETLRSKSALGIGRAEGNKKSKTEGSVRPQSSLDTSEGATPMSSKTIGNIANLSLRSGATTITPSKNLVMNPKNVREWIQYFYEEADMRASAMTKARFKPKISPYELPIPFKE
mmetsp:Transcript_19205/g.63438  ORF Transcript_19205/g.63438 Transcript_19205/m.63438 type:complete len:602 (-) Transcript_19205:1862-3667(-)